MCAVLQDADLRLRPVSLPEDVALALPWYADAEVMDLSEDTSEPYGEDTVVGMYRYLLERGEAYLIEVREEAGTWTPIGDAALTPETVPVVIGSAAHRNRGLGRRVLRLLVRRATDLGWDRLRTKGIWTRNERSRRVYEAVGFELVRVGRDTQGRESWFHELELRDRRSSGAARSDAAQGAAG